MSDLPVQPQLNAPKNEWLVYGDALQQVGDPRGKLIALADKPQERDAWIQENADALLGPLAKQRARYDIGWKWCLAQTLVVNVPDSKSAKPLVEAALVSPVCAQIEELTLACTPSGSRVELAPVVELLGKSLPETCSTVRLIDKRAEASTCVVSRDYDPGRNLVDFGPIAFVLAAPGVQRAELVVADAEQVNLNDIDAPHLKSFSLLCLRWASTYSLPSDNAQALANAKWPELERFELRLPEQFTYSVPDEFGAYVSAYADMDMGDYYDDYYDDDGFWEPVNYNQELGPLFDQLKKTNLQSLRLTSFESASQICELIRDHGLPGTLKVLDLSESALSSNELSFFVEHKDLFRNLDELIVENTKLTDSDAEKLRTISINVKHSQGSGARYRFKVGME